MMKMLSKCAVGLLTCMLLTYPLASQETANVAGKWEMTRETPRGTQTSIFTFEQDGSLLTGTAEGRMGSTPISSGSVDGTVVTFTIMRGRGDRSFEMTYAGTVDGDTITGTMSTPMGEREFTMTRAEGS